MKISEIVEKEYPRLLKMCTRTDCAIYGGKTSEDLLGEAVLTAMKKFGEEDIDEEEGSAYLQKTFLESCLFSWKKKSYPEEKMMEYIAEYPQGI